MNEEEESQLAVFEGKRIRKTIHQGEWWFSIIDVIGALVGDDRPRKYWNDWKKKLSQEGYDQLSDKTGQLKMPSADGKLYATDCANTETMFRIIQSIPSPRVEPLKRWLARVGKERIEYAILTNEIMQGTFGMKVEEYKRVKDLNRENLRDPIT